MSRWSRRLVAMCLLWPAGCFPRTTAPGPALQEAGSERDLEATVLAIEIDNARSTAAGQRPLFPAPALVDSIRGALASIARIDHPARDSVLEIFEIHVTPLGSPDDVLVVVDSTAPWANQWRAGQALTGVASIDTVLALLRPESITEIDFALVTGRAFQVTLGRLTNVDALAERWRSVSEIHYVTPYLSPVAVSKQISFEDRGSTWYITYRLRWGDCPSGCLNEHRWTFEVEKAGYRAGVVTSEGDTVTAEVVQRYFRGSGRLEVE